MGFYIEAIVNSIMQLQNAAVDAPAPLRVGLLQAREETQLWAAIQPFQGKKPP